MTAEKLWIAMALFHVAVLSATWQVARQWRDPARCQSRTGPWLSALTGDLCVLAVFTYLASLAAAFIANLGPDLQRLRVGPITLRLLGQALLVEGVLLGLLLAGRHRTAQRDARTVLLGLLSTALFAACVDAYYIEPQMLAVRRHRVDDTAGARDTRTLRILHITDIQTPSIGSHEELALRTGLSYHPDLIVLTGDYVQDALGRPTEEEAAHDLRALMSRVGFRAPLGVFATEGDVGPPCAVIFAGTDVRCLVDHSERVSLADGGTLGITGLSRGHGRVRSPEFLGRLLSVAPSADHRIIISHAPDFVDALPVAVDLVLAGHTHGGQVVLPFFGPPKTAIRLPRRYAGGLHMFGGTPLHVSRGVGMERGFEIPVRFLCPPEICVLDVRLPAYSEVPRRTMISEPSATNAELGRLLRTQASSRP